MSIDIILALLHNQSKILSAPPTRCCKITLPMVSPTTLLVTITSLINSFQVFDQCYMLTSGGPAKRTYTMAIYIYETAFKQYKLGRASAISLIMFFIIVAISIVQFKLSEKWVNYDT